MKLEKLIEAYNAGKKAQYDWSSGYNIKKPTSKSIQYINSELNGELPETLIEFVKKSNSNDWFASLGDDYDSPFHILKVNKICRSIRRRVIRGKGRWEYVFPKHFIAINLGHDSDYDCIDLSKYNAETGEYAIQYWSPPRIFGKIIYSDFITYMESNLRFWGRK